MQFSQHYRDLFCYLIFFTVLAECFRCWHFKLQGRKKEKKKPEDRQGRKKLNSFYTLVNIHTLLLRQRWSFSAWVFSGLPSEHACAQLTKACFTYVLTLTKTEDFAEFQDIWFSITAGSYNVMLLKNTYFTNVSQVYVRHISCHLSMLIPDEMMYFKHGGICQCFFEIPYEQTFCKAKTMI